MNRQRKEAIVGLAECSPLIESELERCPQDFIDALGELLIVSPPMLDALRSHPDWLGWLRTRVEAGAASEGSRPEPLDLDALRALKRREYLEIAFLDIAGLAGFEHVVKRLSGLADWVIGAALRLCWQAVAQDARAQGGPPASGTGFAVFAMGKLGGGELNYSSDVDLVFCRRDSDFSSSLSRFCFCSSHDE